MKILISFLFIILFIIANLTYAGSLYSDHRALKPGDILIVQITEYTQANQQSNAGTNKSVDMQGGPGVGFLSFVSSFLLQISDKFSSNRNTTQAAQFSGNIGVVVKDVLPNGLLSVEGSKVVTVNGEEQTVYLKGFVRPDDLTKDNSIPSSKVVNLELRYQSSAPKPRDQGILSTILYWLQELLRLLF
ncbi:MAG: flagellar basal body L-ring protein FlgH [bacterium]